MIDTRKTSAWATFAEHIRGDLVRVAKVGGQRPGGAFFVYAWLFLPGFRFILQHRIQRLVASLPVIGRVVARLYWARTCRRSGSEIAAIANVGPGCYMPHPYAIVLGDCTVGRNVVILQCVTIGKRGDDAPRGPIIGDDVEIGAGATILGPITIGQGAKIGANSVVLKDVPAGAIAAGTPARILGAAVPSSIGAQ